jgi:ELWxxDGT repeat protein
MELLDRRICFGIGTLPTFNQTPSTRVNFTAPVALQSGQMMFTRTWGSAREWWTSDGTIDGTRQFLRTATGSLALNLVRLSNSTSVSFQDQLDGATGSTVPAIWRTDGTNAGTGPLPLPPAGRKITTSAGLIVAGGLAYAAVTASGSTTLTGLYVTDGTVAGTTTLTDSQFVPPNDSAFFEFKGQLWARSTNGVAAFRRFDASGWSKPFEISPAASFSSNTTVSVVNDKLYFSTADSAWSRVWVSDGTQAGTRSLGTSAGGRNFSSPAQFTQFSGGVMFDAGGLFAIDPQNQSVSLVDPLGSLASTRQAGGTARSVDGQYVYYTRYDATLNPTPQLWRTRGTAATIALVTSLNLPTNTYPAYGIHNLLGKTYLFERTSATNLALVARQINDGLGQIQSSVTLPQIAGASAAYFSELNGAVYYPASTSTYGRFIGRWDASPTQPTPITPIAYGPESLTGAVEFEGRVLYRSNDSSTSRYQLIASDGTRAGTFVRYSNPYANGEIGKIFDMTVWRGDLYFFAEVTTANRCTLFRLNAGSDQPIALTGLTASQQLYAQYTDPNTVNSGALGPNGEGFVASGNSLYFLAAPFGGSKSLFATNGSPAGTQRVYSAVTNAIDFNGQLLFIGFVSDRGYGPCISDGTPAGTRSLYAFSASSYPRIDTQRDFNLSFLGNSVYFVGYTLDNGYYRYFKSDGTAAGTGALLSQATGTVFPLSPGFQYARNGRIYFIGTVIPESQLYLCSTDGTTAGTRIEANAPSNASFYNLYATWFQGRLIGMWPIEQSSLGDPKHEYFEIGAADNPLRQLTDLVANNQRPTSVIPAGALSSGLLFLGNRSGYAASDRQYSVFNMATRQRVVDLTSCLALNNPGELSGAVTAGDKFYYTYSDESLRTVIRRWVPGVGLIDRRFELTPAGPRVVFEFDTPVNPTSVTVGDLAAFNITTNSPGPAATSVSVSPDGLTATFTLPKSLADGRYRFTIGQGKLSAATGTDTNESDFVHTDGDAFMLRGDANRDGAVNFDDLLLLAANYNTTGKTWSQGDFTFDGTVNFDDLLALAARYNQPLAAAAAPLALSGGPAPSTALAASAPPPVRPGFAVDPPEDGDADSAGVLS